MSFKISNVQYCVCETNSMFSYLMMSLCYYCSAFENFQKKQQQFPINESLC